MTIKQAFIGIVTAIALVIAVLISQIVRINTCLLYTSDAADEL